MLTAVTFPNLESVGTLSIDSNPVLAELGLPSLGEITGELQLKHNPLLSSAYVDPLRGLARSADIVDNRDDPPAL